MSDGDCYDELVKAIDEHAQPGTVTQQGHLTAHAPKEVTDILRKLLPTRWTVGHNGVLNTSPTINLEQAEIGVLEAFAAHVAGVDECKIRAIEGCHSCYLGGRLIGKGCYISHWGNLVHTDCGLQCWHCASEIDCVDRP